MKGPLALIFMGVAGSGKTTVASLFARETGAVFYEGDDYHPAANIEKMRRGVPLTDADREEWLRRLHEVIEQALARNELAVVTCSALKAGYRRRLQDGDRRVRFVYLAGLPELIAQRLAARKGHFLPPSLLASQFAVLEPPAEIEAMTFSVEQSPKKIVAALIQALAAGLPG